MVAASAEDHIVVNQAILSGKPIVRGTRIPVELVLAKLAQDPRLDELFADYPRLTVDDVKACLSYAKDLVARRGRAASRTTEKRANDA